MEVSFATRSMQKACATENGMKKEWGSTVAKKLQQRLAELAAADTLADISHLPPARCHELSGNRAGQLSLDLGHPFRLLLRPDNDPPPKKPDGGLDWAQVTRVIVLEVRDTH